MNIENLAQLAYEASEQAAALSTQQKNTLLLKIATHLENHREQILKANLQDVAQAREQQLNEAMVDRLLLTDSRFAAMVQGVRDVAGLADPIGLISEGKTLSNGLQLYKKTVPLGVIGVIYESRPNVTVDIAALCLKSSNACILRGGSESFATSSLCHALMAEVLREQGLDEHIISFVNSTDRQLVSKMLTLNQYIDVIIPRGGVGLQRMCQTQSSIPVIIGGFGISHIFVDESADLKRSVEVIINAKVQKPSACNALDTLLVHSKIAADFLDLLKQRLVENKVLVHAHGDAVQLLRDYPYLKQGQAEDFAREFLSLEMNIALVENVDAAILHLRKYRANHSDAILTDSKHNADKFCARAGSACVYVNASTRFTDGGQFGLGAEVAISTQKLHARGPMALNELTTYQYVCQGDYLSRA